MENWCFSVYIGNLWNSLCCFFQTHVYQVQLMCQNWWTSHVLSHWCSMLFVFFESPPRWWNTGKICFVLHLRHMYICTLVTNEQFFTHCATRQRSPFTLRLPDLWVRPDDKAGSFCWGGRVGTENVKCQFGEIMWYCWWKKSCTSWYGTLSHYLQGFIHIGWCRISSINSMIVMSHEFTTKETDAGTAIRMPQMRQVRTVASGERFAFSELRSTRVGAGLGCNRGERFDYVGPIYMLLSLYLLRVNEVSKSHHVSRVLYRFVSCQWPVTCSVGTKTGQKKVPSTECGPFIVTFTYRTSTTHSLLDPLHPFAFLNSLWWYHLVATLGNSFVYLSISI